jgi:hypothetical protein
MVAPAPTATGKTHCCVVVLEGDLELFHRVNNHPQAVDDVLEDDDAPFGFLVLGEAIPRVDQAHLLQDRRFPTLAGT